MTIRLGLPGRRAWIRYALWIAIPLALAWALRGVSVADIASALGELSPFELVVLAGVNLGVLLLLGGRWWFLLRSRGYQVPILATAGYRLAGFAVSYFTPGTQFGGEPLQIHLMSARQEVPTPVATASVVLDKTIELASSFAFLAFGIGVVLRLGLQPAGMGFVLLAGALALALVPVAYIVAAGRGAHPATWIALRLGLASSDGGWRSRLRAWLAASEHEVGSAARQAPLGIVGAGAFSAASWGILLLEWALAMQFLGMEMPAGEVVAVVTAARLALFVPLPGAAGALEASLILALTALGFSPAHALSLAVVIRIRDIVFGGFGLWLGGWLAGGRAGQG